MPNTYISSGQVKSNNVVSANYELHVMGSAVINTVNRGGIMTVSSGGFASSTTVSSGGSMLISSGGTAVVNTVSRGGSMTVSRGGFATSTTVKGSAGTITKTWGILNVSSGGTARYTTVSSVGHLYIHNNGTAMNTTISSGGSMTISGSGTHRGTLQIASGGVVSAHTGAVIDYTLTGRTVSDGYLINDLSLIHGSPTYTVTVSSDQAYGTYKLAQGASSFSGSITVGNGSVNYGSVTVNSSGLDHEGKRYLLVRNGGNLTLSITDILPPEAPTAGADITAPTNGNVTVSASFSSDSAQKQYSLNNADWDTYTSGVVMTANGTVYFRGIDAAGNVSDVTSYVVSNIDKVVPTVTIHADDTAPYAPQVTLTAVIEDEHLTAKEYSLDGKTWQTYTGGVTVLVNGAVWFRGSDSAGNVTTSAYVVANIGDAPVKVYSSGVLVSRGDVFSGVELTGGGNDSMIVISGGYTLDTVISEGGSLTVLSGGMTESSTVDGGTLVVSSGGVAGNITEISGSIIIEDGASADFLPHDTHDEVLDSSTTVRSGSIAEDNAIVDGGEMTVFSGASAVDTTIFSGGSMILSGGASAIETVIFSGGRMTLSGGEASSTVVSGGLLVSDGGTATDTTVGAGGWLHVSDGGSASGAAVDASGYVRITDGGEASDITVNGDGRLGVAGGSADGILVTSGGWLVVNSDGEASDIIIDAQGEMHVLSGGAASDMTVSGAAYASQGGSVADTAVGTSGALYVGEGGTATDTVVSSGGKLSIEGGVHSGTLQIASGATVSAYAGAVIDFTLTGRTADAPSLINDLSLIEGAPTFTITVDDDPADGIYRLAQDADGFSASITIGDGTVDFGDFTANGTPIRYGNSYYLLEEIDGDLTLSVFGKNTQKFSGSQIGVDWSGIASRRFTVDFSADDFASTLSVTTSGSTVDLCGMPSEVYRWQVNTIDAGSVAAYAPSAPQALVSDADGNLDLFFAVGRETWGSFFSAQHTGTLDGWDGTGELVYLKGKNCIVDVFAGSTDANILVLTDDVNGDALFMDDIFTALPDDLFDQARIAQIREIRAGAGSDVVDLTSQQFAYTNGLTVYGGLGDDTIWANTGDNRLFGDAGNDRIIGAAGDDLIVGGIGNDAMHGGGGNDVFTFCENWGIDTVEQLPGGSVTLWFASGSMDNWDASTLTYSDGANSVTVSGITAENITLKFGDASPDYAALSAAGAFSSAASEKIFEDPTRGMIA